MLHRPLRGLGTVAAALLLQVGPAVAQQPVQHVSRPGPPSNGQVLGAHEDIYEALFDSPWSIDTSLFLLDGVYWGGLGTLTGSSDQGLPFSFDVTSGELVDYTQIGLTPAEVSALVARGVLGATVEGTISTGLASFEVSARTLAYVDEAGGVHSLLLLGYYLDPPASGRTQTAGGGLEGTQGEPPYPPIPGMWKLEHFCITVTGPCVLDTPPCNQCYLDYESDLAGLQNQYLQQQATLQNALDTAQATHQQCRSSALVTYATNQLQTEALYFTALLGCGFAPPPFNVACFVGATAAATIARIKNAVDYYNDVNACDGALAIAQNQYQANMNALNAFFDAERERLEQDLADCLANNECLATCTTSVCYWRFEFCPTGDDDGE